MSTFEAILDAYFAEPTSNEHETLFRALKRLHPQPNLQHVGYLQRFGQTFQLLDYLKSEGIDVLVEEKALMENLRWDAGAKVDENTTKKHTGGGATKGRLRRSVRTGILTFAYHGTEFKVYQVSWTKNGMSFTFYDFIFEFEDVQYDASAEDAELLYQYSPQNSRNLAKAHLDTPAHHLLTAALQWSDATKSEIWVFQRGSWTKDKSLYKAVSRATWDDLTLHQDFLESLRRDTQTFFSSREAYEELGVTWKRGLLMLGPPGNGKTESVKVLLKESGQTSLYVKSFTTACGPEVGVEAIFSHARAHAPCVLVIEDLDTLVKPEVRSFFLNELDGLADNAGILTIATTNHPELIDDAILNRPSRFDVKYTFNCPDEELRKVYIRKWMAKTGETDDVPGSGKSTSKKLVIKFEDEEGTAKEVAKRTDGWSFAFLKELFVSFLLRLAHDKARGSQNKDAAKATPDSVLLDQVEKLSVQVGRSAAEDKNKPAVGIPGMGSGSFAASNVFEHLNNMMDGGSTDSAWR